MTSNHKSDLRRVYTHLNAIGLGQLANPLHRDISRWVNRNGPKWTVDRLKDLKQAFLQLLAGNTPVYSTWISHHPSGMPKGNWKLLFRQGLKHPKRTQRVISALVSYTAFTSEKLLDSQLEAAKGSIFQYDVPDDNPVIESYLGLINQGDVNRWKRIMTDNYCERFTFAGLNSGKPTLIKRKSTDRSNVWIESLTDYLRIHNPFDPILRRMGLPAIGPVLKSYRDYPSGRIGVIQERGFKARVVAMPNAAAQVAFQPLHSALDKVLRSLYEDCTHEQERGAEWASKQLAAGKTLHAIDLSSATDHFPFLYQVNFLDKILPDKYKDVGGYLYRFVKYSTWTGPDGKPWRYTRGQPMGLYSSFPLFALSHHALVRSLFKGKSAGLPYRILGDDIIIADDELAADYRRALGDLSIPISYSKTISSNLVTEFAGFIITPKGYYKPVKVPKPSSKLEDSFLDYLRVVGPSGLGNLPSRTRKVASIVSRIPTEFGGLGWNPEGLSYSTRLGWVLDLLDQEDWVVPNLVDLAPDLMKSFMLMPKWTESHRVFQFLSDQLRLSILRCRELLPSHLSSLENPRELVYQVREALADPVPGFAYFGVITQSRSSKWRSSLLDQWERKLGRLHNNGFYPSLVPA